jgi:uncharacterized protein YdcH (DUF465 family)
MACLVLGAISIAEKWEGEESKDKAEVGRMKDERVTIQDE